jgi:hypothetical protein
MFTLTVVCIFDQFSGLLPKEGSARLRRGTWKAVD